MFLYCFVLTDHEAFSRILWVGNYVIFFFFSLPSIVITSLGEERAGRSAGRLLVCPHYVVPKKGCDP